MPWLFLLGCVAKDEDSTVDETATLPTDSADADTDTDADADGDSDSDGDTDTDTPVDDDCDGFDDDGNGVVDDGGRAGWWGDPLLWQDLFRVEDAAETRFVAAMAMGPDHRYVLVEEVSADFSDAAVAIDEVVDGALVEVARIPSDGALPFVYAASLDPWGVLWIGGAWYDVSANERTLLVAYLEDGKLVQIADPGGATDVRVSSVLADGTGAWLGGYATNEVEPTSWTVWRARRGAVEVADAVGMGGGGRVSGLAPGRGVVYASGWMVDAEGGTEAVLRSSDGSGFVDVGTLEEARFVDVTSASGDPWLAATEADGTGWTVRNGLDLTVADEVTADLSHVVVDGPLWFAAGTRMRGDGVGTYPYVRAAQGEWLVSYDLEPEAGWTSEPHTMAVAEDGGVWLALSERPEDGSAPTRGRVLHLYCR